MVCGISVPQPGVEPGSTAVKARVLTTVPPGESLSRRFFDDTDSSSDYFGQS